MILEYSSSDKGHLLLDTGHISITGFIGAAGMSLNVAITDINAGLPLSIHDKINLGEKSLYLKKLGISILEHICYVMVYGMYFSNVFS